MSKKPNESAWHWFMGRMRTHFLAGVLVIVPVAASVLILVWIFTTIDNILQPIIKEIFGRSITGLGFGVTILLVFIVGIIAGNYVGRRLIHFGDSLLKRVPLFRQIYTGAKQVMDGFSGTGAISKAAFREVVLVEFPARGMTTVAFITNEFKAQTGERLFAVYIPTSPTPWAGFAAIVTEGSMTRTNISVDEALKMCISGMMISPSTLQISSGGKMITLSIDTNSKTATEEPPQG
jgi:uncharacterized membrane protein